MFCTGDILVHTWDLARATGLDETLDADEVHRMFVGMEPMDEMLRASGHYARGSRCRTTPTSRPSSSPSPVGSRRKAEIGAEPRQRGRANFEGFGAQVAASEDDQVVEGTAGRGHPGR